MSTSSPVSASPNATVGALLSGQSNNSPPPAPPSFTGPDLHPSDAPSNLATSTSSSQNPSHDQDASPDLSRTPFLEHSTPSRAPSSSLNLSLSMPRPGAWAGAPVSPPLQPGQWDAASAAGSASFVTAEFGDAASDYSPVPSIASVRVATKVARAQASASRLGGSVEQGGDGGGGGRGGDGLWVAGTVENRSAMGLGFDESSQAGAGVPPLVMAGSSTDDLSRDTAGADAHVAHRSSATPSPPGNASLAESDAAWKASLDAMVDHLSASAGTDGLRPDAGPEARFTSILGPKLKIVSKAPWDDSDSPLDEQQVELELATPVAVAAVGPAVPRKSGDARRPAEQVAGQGANGSPGARESGKPPKPGRSKSFSFSSSRKPPPSPEDVAERDDAFRGLGLGLSQGPTSAGMSASPSQRSLRSLASGLGVTIAGRESLPPSPPVLHSRKSTGSPTKLSSAALGLQSATGGPRDSGARSAPAHITAFSAREVGLLTRSDSASSTGLSAFAAGGFPDGLPLPLGPMSLAAKGGAAGPGYKLISLDEARAREGERVAAAAKEREAHRKAMQPVEHIAGQVQVGERERVRETTADSTSTRGSQAFAPKEKEREKEGAARPAVRQRKSGFLKRIMGDKQSHTSQIEPVPPLPSLDSFRTLASHYADEGAPTLPVKNLDTGAVEQYAVSPAAGGPDRVAFGATPKPPAEGRGASGLSKLPALSLRPMSMAFSAGLPVDFLAGAGGGGSASTTSAELSAEGHGQGHGPDDEREQLADSPGPSPRFAPSITSSTGTASSAVFDSDYSGASSSGAAGRTPLTPAFPSPAMSHASLPGSAGLATAEGYAALREQYARATSAWMKERHGLEKEVREMRGRAERAEGLLARERVGAGGGLAAEGEEAAATVSVLDRSRAVRPNLTGTAMFGGARA